jgi:HK97 family phage major capsid protein
MNDRERALADEIRETWAKADGEGRNLSRRERARVESAVEELEDGQVRRKMNARIGNLLGAGDGRPSDPNVRFGGERPGDAFVKSAGYQQIRDSATRPSRWSSGPIEVKATLLEGDLDTPGAGAPLSPFDVRPGIQPVLFQPTTIASLIATTQTSTNRVRVVVESLATNAADVVAEGGAKPESTLEFEERDEPVRKIATFLPISDELISDAPGLQGYLNGRLSLFVQQEEENQLLNGDGSGINLAGILDRVPPANTGIASTVTGANSADHIYEALTVAAQSYLMPDGIVVNPEDWGALRLVKDSQGNYIGGSPFSNAAQPGEALWGKRVVITEAIAAGTVLVGAFGSGATLFRRGGLSVEASNSHADYFQKDLVAIRAETRLALAVHRPEAFATADLSAS